MVIADRRRDGFTASRRAFLRAAACAIGLALVGSVLQAEAAEGEVKTVVIPVEGMACVACAASVKRALKAIDGVAQVEVNLERRSARVTYAPAKVAPDRLVAAINKLGYRAGTPKEAE
jgi:copper chaperone CopZ